MEYEKEFGNLNKAGNVFKATAGVYKLEILEEPVETEFTANDGKVTEQIKLLVQNKSEEMVWYISKGSTTRSLYGQLMALGKFHGKLQGQKITLSVTKSKNKDGNEVNSYSILESVEVLPQLEKPKEEDIN